MTPQHMQQLDGFHLGALHARLEAVDRDNWGVVGCTLDETALDSGMVGLQMFEGILPDGTPVSFDGVSAQAPASRPIEGHVEAHDSLIDVYLGLPGLQEGRNNVGSNKGELARYYASSETVHDRHGQAQPQVVDIAQPNLRILFGDEARQDFSAIKVVELKRSGSGHWEIAQGYIAPCVRVGASAALSEVLGQLLTSMNARRSALLETVRQRDDSSVEYGAADVTKFLLLDAINAAIPFLKHAVEAGDVSSKMMYLFLGQLAGQLSTFSTKFDPNDVPRFVYTDLRSTFDGVLNMIQGLLGATLQKRYVAVPLLSRGDGLHVGEISDDRFGKCTQFIIGVGSTVAEGDVSAKLPRLAKLASMSDIHSLLAAATSGVELHATMKPPPQIPTRAGMSYFVVRTESPYWRNILVERKFAMYLPTPFSPTDTEVHVYGVLS